MAWNEPGGGRDPWGGNKNNGNNGDGPPDLDEALQKLRERFGSIFGGGNGGSGNGSSKAGSGAVIAILVVLLILWALSGIYQVDAKERAVILTLGKYSETVGPGLHWNPSVVDSVTIVNVTEEQDYESRGQMLTQDENIVEVPVTVQYNISDPKAYVLNVKDPVASLRHSTDSAVRHVVGSTKSNDVLSEGRQALAIEVKLRLQNYLDSYGTGINITTVNLLKAEPPREVKSAFDDVIAAKEDKDRYKNEAETYSNGLVPEARGQAQRIFQEAEAYRDRVVAEAEGEAQRFVKLLTEYEKAPEVTRERLYLDALQEVMSNTSKVMIDVDGGNNMMYLPLDKLGQQSTATNLSGAASRIGDDQIREIANDVIELINREQTTSRRRELR
jgi:membrane protease subunit HflK